MSSIVINVPSGYINAFLFLLTEIIVINLIVTSIRKRLDAYNTYKSLAKGNRISLRQVNILGIETRRDRYSLIMLSLTLLTIISLSIMEWGVNGETTMKTAMYEGIVIGGDSMIGYSKKVRISMKPRKFFAAHWKISRCVLICFNLAWRAMIFRRC